MESIEPGVIIAIILGLTEVIKKLGLKSRFAPAVAVVIGIIASCVTYGFSGQSAFLGVLLSLTAMGMFSGVKTSVK